MRIAVVDDELTARKMISRILMQADYEVETFEALNKHLVLVVQDHFLRYTQREFQFEHIKRARLGDSVHIHSYRFFKTEDGIFHINHNLRHSTDSNGIATSLGLGVSPKVELQAIIAVLEDKISAGTRLVL